MMTKKDIKEEAKRFIAKFHTKEMAKNAISEIQRVLMYMPVKDSYGLNWREYFRDVDAEVEKMQNPKIKI